MTRRFVLNETSYFGAGSREAIAEEVARKGLKKALIVTDSSLVKFGVVAKVSEVLDKAGVPFEIFDDILSIISLEQILIIFDLVLKYPGKLIVAYVLVFV